MVRDPGAHIVLPPMISFIIFYRERYICSRPHSTPTFCTARLSEKLYTGV